MWRCSSSTIRPRTRAKIGAEIARALDEDHAEAIVLGCAGMADLAASLGKEFGVPVIDGVERRGRAGRRSCGDWSQDIQAWRLRQAARQNLFRPVRTVFAQRRRPPGIFPTYLNPQDISVCPICGQAVLTPAARPAGRQNAHCAVSDPARLARDLIRDLNKNRSELGAFHERDRIFDASPRHWPPACWRRCRWHRPKRWCASA